MPGKGQPLLAEDLIELVEGECAEGIGNTMIPTYEQAREMQSQQNSWTFFSDEYDPLACGGFIPVWPGRWIAWLYVAGNVPRQYRISLLRYIKSRFNGIHGRIEAEVRADFVKGQRLLETLGFYVENPPGILRQYGPAGEDFVSYVRFN